MDQHVQTLDQHVCTGLPKSGINICSNPECHKPYDLADKNSDRDFCSFNCWEKVNCKNPQQVSFEHFSLAGIE
jgi:hypothetical protein